MNKAILLAQVHLHCFQLSLEQSVLLRCVISLLFERDSLCVELFLLKGLNVVRHVLLTRCHVVSKARQVGAVSRFSTLTDLGKKSWVTTGDWVR